MALVNLWLYSGPVMRFDTCIDNKWRASTYAVSEKRARVNLAYRYKQLMGLSERANIALPGKLQKVEGVDFQK